MDLLLSLHSEKCPNPGACSNPFDILSLCMFFQAREGQQYEYIPCLIRAGFDGGVCAKGSACGAWIEIGLKAKNDFRNIIYRDVYEAAWCLDSGSTVTQTELSAAEHIIGVLPQIICNFFQRPVA